ncbi:methionine aminotransferase [Gramella sp. AN32]|uniref:Methionine aminotransferase n=1 Tax=Christiangramia antarctica TaxID=2058158 RepID=A0ABW5WZH3_9FLAO|nr:methionine aminotransferase [Gramella sp. AN32]MCM4155146.1 methionine aminotransferase [Gramella sp. AN32]
MQQLIKISSKLPSVTPSIFSIMSQLAKKHNAIDLSQGFPNFESDTRLKEMAIKAIENGFNQYAPMEGILPLRMRIAEKIAALYDKFYDFDTEITVTNGATEAIYSAITAFVKKDDEVIVFKPAYDTYEPTIKLNGGKPVQIQLKGEDYRVDWSEVASAITSQTKMIIINTPHNPSGTILDKYDMQQLEKTLRCTKIILLSDEVYEHIIFDDKPHESVSSFPALAERAIVCASFGKTFHNTGWKTGYCVAPKELMQEIRKVHQYCVFCINHPLQYAFTEYLKNPEHYRNLGNFYQQKRDLFLDLIQNSKFTFTPSKGTYFQLLGFENITDERDTVFAERLVKEFNIASIPVSVFNIAEKDQKELRFCFAKTDETLEKAAKILCSL